MTKEGLNRLSNKIIGIAIEIHRTLGPGFVEKIYQKALELKLEKNKFKFEREKRAKIGYEGIIIGYQILDFIIEDELLVELKAVSEINRIHQAQMLSYLKATNKKLGLILNFAAGTLEIKRVVNKF